jgi:hypothetical protein
MRSAPFILALVLVVGGFLSLQTPTPGEAQIPCVATTVEGDPRNCTYMEKYGGCLADADDSLEQCKSGATGFKAAVCYMEWTVNYAACLPASFLSKALSMI